MVGQGVESGPPSVHTDLCQTGKTVGPVLFTRLQARGRGLHAQTDLRVWAETKRTRQCHRFCG